MMPMVAAQNCVAEAGWWRRDIAPLGIQTAIMADHPMLLDLACAAYADWAVPHPAAAPMIEIRLRLTHDVVARASDGIRVDGLRLSVTGRGIDGGADASTGRGWCSVPARLLDDAAALTAEVIDPILLFLLARLGRPPLHAAGVLLGNTAVLLAGASGSGKSTLALAAAAQGLTVLSDDIVHLQLEPVLRVWGLARPIHVFAEEAPAGNHAIRVRGGKRKAEIYLPDATQRRHADHAILVVLARGDRLALDPIARAAGVASLLPLEAGFDLLPRESARIADAVVARGAWRLTLTDDPDAAIALLRAGMRSLVG